MRAHRAQLELDPYLTSRRANSPAVLSAAAATYYGVLAIGARMDGALGAADAYIGRARAALAAAHGRAPQCWGATTI